MNLNPFRKKQSDSFIDLGYSFGTTITSTKERFINKDGSFNIHREGFEDFSLYQSLTSMSWWRFLAFVVLLYIGINTLFAFCYLFLGVNCLYGVESTNFWMDFSQAFFFSIQTFTTVGYGAISPLGIGANSIAAMGALVGLLSFAIVTGLCFARFAKPVHKILYSKYALLASYKDGLSFQFRIANKQDDNLVNLSATVTMTWVEVGKDGIEHRRFSSLELERDKIFLFPLNWNIVHPITKNSPLFRKSKKEVDDMHAEFLVIIQGYDQVYNQKIHSMTSYTTKELLWNAQFKTMYHSDEQRGTVLELDEIDEVIKA